MRIMPVARVACGAAVLSLALLVPHGASAQDLTDTAYQRLRPLATRLDDAARDARWEAREAARNGGDEDLANRIGEFAGATTDLRDKIDNRNLDRDDLKHQNRGTAGPGAESSRA